MGCQTSTTQPLIATSKQSNLAIGIEGGGTKTRIIITDTAISKILYSKLFNIPSNHYLTSLEQVCTDFKQIIFQAENEAKLPHSQYLGLTVAGFNNPSSYVDEFFNSYTTLIQSHDTNGARQMFQRQFQREPAVVISGTGSAGFFKKQVGGLGHFLKERGCGFSAVRRAIEEACVQFDGIESNYGEFGDLWTKFAEFFGFSKENYQESGILDLFYSSGFKNKVAGFNVEMMTNQSELVRKIYGEEFAYLGDMVEVLKNQGKLTDIICVGGFWGSLEHQKEAKKAFFSRFPDVKFWKIRDDGSALGVALEAAGVQWKGEGMFDEFK